MTLNSDEEALILSLRTLPPSMTSHALLWIQHVTELAWAGPVEWSDSWSEEDLQDATRASMQAFDRLEANGQ